MALVEKQSQRSRSAAKLAQRTAAGLGALLLFYFLAAYLIAPLSWQLYERRQTSLDAEPRRTVTGSGHPGDPLNVALVGTLEQVQQAMQRAGWYQAAPLGAVDDLEIAADAVLNRPDPTAPVSRLYLFGRVEDVAFEQPVGNSPRKRHHVRFWRSSTTAPDGRPLWLGAASFDASVGFSHTTGQITHHIDPNVDAARDHLVDDLQRSGAVPETFKIAGFHTVTEGRNGGGDRWQSDGCLLVAVLASR